MNDNRNRLPHERFYILNTTGWDGCPHQYLYDSIGNIALTQGMVSGLQVVCNTLNALNASAYRYDHAIHPNSD